MTRVLLVPDLPQERWPSMDRYASRLERHLRAEAPDLDYVLASPIDDLTSDHPHPGSKKSSAATRFEFLRYLNRYVRYPRRIRHRPADVIHVLDHSYAHVVRSRPDVPALVTVHDLLPVLTLERARRGPREAVRNALLKRVLAGLRAASAWIVATRWMRAEVAAWLGREDAIHVVPYGVDEAFFAPPTASREAIRESFGVPAARFLVLHVGSTAERKNIPGVLAAVHGLRRRGLDAGLLQVGGHFTRKQRAAIHTLELDDVTVQRSAVSEETLRAAYRSADALLFPSHYEGFGLPLLEAMASSLPVVASAAPAPAEVTGDGGVVVEGRDPQRYVEALERIALDDAWATELRRRGEDRSRQFTWAETARRTAEVYRSLG